MQKKAIEILKDRLYWISDVSPPNRIPDAFYFCIDNELVYQPFYKDFGPLNLGCVWKYVTELEKLLSGPKLVKRKVYHYTSTDPEKASNAAFLIGAYQVVCLGYSTEKAFAPFKNIPFKAFRDASYGECSYKCTISDCLRGLEYAIKLGWFNYRKFNIAEYEHYERIENGDINWIVPNKFVAFSSPYDSVVDKYGSRLFTPKDYVPIFKKLGVTMVVRLNNVTYDAKGFTKEGIKHHELFFTDGTAPTDEIVDQFLELAEKENGALAIHCKAGLGRTGSLIACYAMKHYFFPAADFIGWIRIARPGSILGPQQQFLIQQEARMREKSITSPIWKEVSQMLDETDTIMQLKNVHISSEKYKMNEREQQILLRGDIGQGENLMEAKMKRDRVKSQMVQPNRPQPPPKVMVREQRSVSRPLPNYVFKKSTSSTEGSPKLKP